VQTENFLALDMTAIC